MNCFSCWGIEPEPSLNRLDTRASQSFAVNAPRRIAVCDVRLVANSAASKVGR
jgi:hypothetical protein